MLSAAATASPAMAGPGGGGPFGLGIIVGEPTGITGKLFTSETTAISGAAAWSLGGSDRFHIQVDYLMHRYDPIRVEQGRAPIYFGLGGRIVLRNDKDTRVGLRIPVGVAYEFENAPFDTFLELAPVLDIAPSTDFFLEGTIGGRFYF
jgi:hypothetical protein